MTPSGGRLAGHHRALVLLFLLSGISGLVYEIVWLRMLIRAFGVTIYAVSTVLGVFMAGLAVGAVLASRRFRASPTLLRKYGALELAIGVSSTLATVAIAWMPEAYGELARSFGAGNAALPWMRFVLSVATLALPTVLMGATLPIMSGYLISHGEDLARRAGLLYGVNTLGAVLGTVGAGFVLLGWLGEVRTVAVGAAINVAVGALALLLARNEEAASVVLEKPRAPTASSSTARFLVGIYGVSGFCALAYEVVWSRLLNLLLGNSVYGFSAMLGTYLAGLAIGSVILARFAGRARRPLLWFATLELAIAFLVLVSLHVFVMIGVGESDPRYTFSQIWSATDFGWLFVKAVAVVFPTTLALGALFPVATLALREEGDAPAIVGKLYAANTAGAIVGSLLTGFVLIPLLGTLLSLMLASLLSFGLGLIVLQRIGVHRRWHLAAVLGFVLLGAFSFRDPFLVVLRARVPPEDRLVAHEETKSGTVTVFDAPNGSRDLYINGLYVSSNSFAGRFMMHAPLLLHAAPQRALIVGLGAGEAFVAAQLHGAEATVVDLSEAVVGVFPLFQPGRESYLGGARGRVVISDGRNFLLSTDQRFDAVLVDGTPPIFASGMVNLYSREFVSLVRSRLTPDGIFVIWVPVYCFAEDAWMIIRNFSDVFAHVQVWAQPGPTGILVFGSDTDFELRQEILTERLRARGLDRSEPVFRVSQLVQGMSHSEERIRSRASSFPPLTDDRPFTEFPLARFLSGARLEETSGFIGDALRR